MCVETAQGGPASWVPTGAPGGEGEQEEGEEPPPQAEGGQAAAVGPDEAVAGTSGGTGTSSAAAEHQQQVALAEITTADQLKAMGLCDTLIILGDTAHGAQPVSLVSSFEPVQCLTAGTAAEAVARAGGNLVLCLPEDTLALEVAASGQEGVPTWAWLQHDPSGAVSVNEAVAAGVRASAPVVVSATPTLATAPGEMLLVMDSAEDSVGMAAKSWFNDSVIATQALLTLEGHK